MRVDKRYMEIAAKIAQIVFARNTQIIRHLKRIYQFIPEFRPRFLEQSAQSYVVVVVAVMRDARAVSDKFQHLRQDVFDGRRTLDVLVVYIVFF